MSNLNITSSLRLFQQLPVLILNRDGLAGGAIDGGAAGNAETVLNLVDFLPLAPEIYRRHVCHQNGKSSVCSS